MKLINHRHRLFSQSGEDGIIAHVFQIVGPGNRFCCEFGAGDGVALSNTRALIGEGWSALLIEADETLADKLKENYAQNSRVFCHHAAVDTASNNLTRISERSGLAGRRFDFLSIDIDGSDFEIFSTLGTLGELPRLVLVEVQPEHGPHRVSLVPPHLARSNVGQPLSAFIAKGREIGYRFIGYLWCNAFFLAEDVGFHDQLPTASAEEAWTESMQLVKQSPKDAEYIYLRNLGLAGSRYRFNNPQLSAEWLGISPDRAKSLYRSRTTRWQRVKRTLQRAF